LQTLMRLNGMNFNTFWLFGEEMPLFPLASLWQMQKGNRSLDAKLNKRK
jgi:hypothetical protein